MTKTDAALMHLKCASTTFNAKLSAVVLGVILQLERLSVARNAVSVNLPELSQLGFDNNNIKVTDNPHVIAVEFPSLRGQR